MPAPRQTTLMPANEREALVVANELQQLGRQHPDLADWLDARAKLVVSDYYRRASDQLHGTDARGRWAMRPSRVGESIRPGRGHIVVTWGNPRDNDPKFPILCGGTLFGRNVELAGRATLDNDPPMRWGEHCRRCLRVLAHLTPPGATAPPLTGLAPVIDLAAVA